jgi:SAM-dependent methyltransferase
MTLVQKIADRFHRLIFDNRDFWNQRYTTDPQKGSGPGSRGENLTLKRKVIDSVITEHGISSVLDIGCGDIAILDSLEIRNYVGIDISDIVVRQNKARRPEWDFVCEDLAGAFQPPSAELVLCLDVLIHQKARKDYIGILSKALNSSTRIALISGYSKPFEAWNVFYHEPLTESVRRVRPADRIELLGEYRGTDLIKVEVAALPA